MTATRSTSIRRWLLAGFALLGVAALVSAIVLGFQLAPWVAEPKQPAADIERRWALVEQWAATDAESGPLGPLAELDDDARVAGSELRRVIDGFRADEEGAPRILEAELGGAARRTLARLEAWHRTGGGLGDPSCVDAQPSPLAALDAGRIALASAQAPDGDRMEAALALIAALQRHGSMVQAFVGDALAGHAARVFADRGWPATEPLRAVRPRADRLFVVLARDAVCSDRMIRAAAGEGAVGGWAVEHRPPVGDGDWPPLGLMNMAREQQVFRGHLGALLEAAHAQRDDYRRMADAMAPFEEDPPQSVFVRIAACPTAGRVRSLGGEAERFDRLVEGLPRGVEPPGESDPAPADSPAIAPAE